LFLDTLQKSEGSLPNFRLALAVVIHFLRHRSEMPEDKRNVSYDPYSEDAPEHQEDVIAKPVDHVVMTAKRRWQLAIRRVIQANRTAVVFGTTQYRGPPIDYSTFVIVDFICPVLFEIVTITGFVVEFFATLSINSAFYRYLRLGFFCMGFYLILWIICHFWSSRYHRMRELVANYHRTRRELERKVEKIVHEETFKSFWLLDLGFRFSLTLKRFLSNFTSNLTSCRIDRIVCCKKKEQTPYQTIADDDDDDDETFTERVERIHERAKQLNPWRRLSLDAKLAILLPMVILSAVFSFVSFYGGWVIMGFFMILLANTFQARFPQVTLLLYLFTYYLNLV